MSSLLLEPDYMQSRYEAANQETQQSALSSQQSAFSVQRSAFGHRANPKRRPHPFGPASRQKANSPVECEFVFPRTLHAQLKNKCHLRQAMY
jgi:hypothetical protein